MIHIHRSPYYRIYGLLLLCICSALNAQTSNEAKEFKIDSTLHAYYDLCRGSIQSATVLPMSDTLFEMARVKGDQRMQAVALATKLDYYYYQAIEDSILSHTNQVKAFAKATNQPKYYYFAWGKRLIVWYIKKGKLNTALYEADKMLKEAQKSNEKAGLATCYNCLSSIYEMKKMRAQSLECNLKQVELIETYKLDDYNISLTYNSISEYYINHKELKKALHFMQKAEATAHSPAQKVNCMAQYVSYYLAAKQPTKALKYLQSIQLAYSSNKQLAISRKKLFAVETQYYLSTRQYPKALEAIEKNEKAQKELGEEGVNINILRRKGEIYWQMGDNKRSAENLMEYINIQDSVNEINEQNSASEFATLLGVEKLNAENKELQVKSQKEQLNYTRNISLSLAICLLIGVCFLIREYLLNKRLRNSENSLIEKNNKLIESEEQLRQAKERAEKNSQMKSAFIQNMTHEIRTPLNSIVGFSQVLSDLYQENNDTKEFANIIEGNSNKLLKLIDDVLDISDLESKQELNVCAINLNDCCQLSIERTRPFLQEGVNLLFHPTYSKLMVISNGERISQILFNLLQNAAKFTQEGSIELTYQLSEDRAKLLMAVTDTGIGVPDDKQEEIFVRFAKVSDFSQGFGLGLSIGRLLAQKLGGDLVMDKTYTKGCRFLLSLPYRPA